MHIFDNTQSFFVTGSVRMRLDRALALQLPAYSRSYLQQLIEQGLVWVDGVCIRKVSWHIPRDVMVEVRPAFVKTTANWRPAIHEEVLNIPIILEHEHFAVINKPAGLMVHAVSGAGSEVHPQGPTVVDWLRSALPAAAQVGCNERPGIVHRLDKDTSGLMVVVKDQRAYAWFGALFKDRAIKKSYRAIVHGRPPLEGSVDYNIMRHPTKRTHMAHSYLYGKAALTEFKTVQYLQGAALIEAYPATGRTHQIRVHCAAIGYPILGDAVYFQRSPHIGRQALHAYRLTFEYDGVAYSCEAPLPDDMEAVLEALSV